MLTVWTISTVHVVVGECKVCIRGAVGLEPVSDRHRNSLIVLEDCGSLTANILVTASKGTLG